MNRAQATVLVLVLTGLCPGLARAADAAPPAAAAAPATAAAIATVEQPRSFGHVLGDVLTQRVLLADQVRPLEPAALPAAARVDLWFERRPSRIETDVQGRRWLAIDYQLINSPHTLSAIALPALTLATKAGPAITVPAWPVSVGPLAPEQAFGQGDLQPLRPDRAVAPLAVHAIERSLQAALLTLAALLLAWLAWWAWRNRREAQQLPFAHAWRELKRLEDPASPQAWRLVHHALNRSAGRVMQGASLPQLLAHAPYLRPLQPQLEAFYRESTRQFYAVEHARGARGAPTDYPLKSLCRALRDAEQRQRH